MKLKVYPGSTIPSRKKKAPTPLTGKAVTFHIEADGPLLAGVVKGEGVDFVDVGFAVPDESGVLIAAANATIRLSKSAVTEVDLPAVLSRDVRAWQTNEPVEDTKAAVEIKDGDRIVDYRGVSFSGYGSTFKETTPEDRVGDYILEGAFTRTLKRFRENPVMLIDHQRSVLTLAGHYNKISVNARGLALEGFVTDQATEFGRQVRFSIMEKSLRTLSIGGLFFYLEDFRGIQEVDLFEVSLVVIPANPDANFIVRALDGATVTKAFTSYLRKNGGELRAKIG